MKLIYMDNCCFNRPYDDQASERIKLETEAKLHIQELIRKNYLHLAWSFILDFENDANPYIEQRYSISEWKQNASIFVPALEEIRAHANAIHRDTGLKSKDALHVACASFAKADFLLTTDKKMLKSNIKGISILNPVPFVFLLSEEDSE